MIKPDEIAFLVVVAEKPHDVNVREIVNALHDAGKLNFKRAWFLLRKWGGKGLYASGVAGDFGWLLPKGFEQAAAYGAVPNPHPKDNRPFVEQITEAAKSIGQPRSGIALWGATALQRYDQVVKDRNPLSLVSEDLFDAMVQSRMAVLPGWIGRDVRLKPEETT